MGLMGSQWGAGCGMRGACMRVGAPSAGGGGRCRGRAGPGPLLSGCTPDPLEQPGGRVWLPHPGRLLQLSQGATSPAGDSFSLSQEGWGRLGLPPEGFSLHGHRQLLSRESALAAPLHPPHPRRAPAPAHIRARFPGNGQDWTHRAGSVRWAAGGPWIEVKVAATFGANGAGLCTVWVRGAFSSSNNRWATRGPRGWARVLVWKASLPLLWCRNCRRHIFRSHLTSECDSPRGPCHRRLTGLQPRVEMTTFGPAVASVHVEASCWTPGAGRLQWEPSRGSAPR